MRRPLCLSRLPTHKTKVLAQPHQASLATPVRRSSTPSQNLNLEISPWNGRTVCLLFNLLPLLPPPKREANRAAAGKFEAFFGMWQYFNFKQMVGGRGPPNLGGALHLLLLPEGWKHLARALAGNSILTPSLSFPVENQFTRGSADRSMSSLGRTRCNWRERGALLAVLGACGGGGAQSCTWGNRTRS